MSVLQIGDKVQFIDNDSWRNIGMKLAYIPPDRWEGKVSVVYGSGHIRINNWWIGGVVDDDHPDPRYRFGFFDQLELKKIY